MFLILDTPDDGHRSDRYMLAKNNLKCLDVFINVITF